MKIFSFSPFGYEGALVACEVDLRRGIPAVDVVGLADSAVKESRERMRSAIRNSGFEFPLERVLISLSPADLKKEGAGFDLALALAVLDAQYNAQNGKNSGDSEKSVLVMGELELSGLLRPVRGVHAAAGTALAAGIDCCIVSAQNASEAREVAGMKVFAAKNLAEAFDALYKPELFSGEVHFSEEQGAPKGSVCVDGVLFPPVEEEFEFGLVKGQKKLIRALQIAAAGGHNLLAFGPPGCGKTLALQKFPGLLPLLTVEEAQSVTRIHSLAGLLPSCVSIVRKKSFRMPHQTATIEGICGGGVNCRPGEISLAHNGVLFLDEAAEFRSSVLQMLRVPLETASITLSRAGRSTVYPADFQLLLAANPCPCGNYGVEDRLCLCSARAVEMYWKKFSGPLLDRVDLRVCVGGERENEGKTEGQAEGDFTTENLRRKVAAAVKVQRVRGVKNARLSPKQILELCPLDGEKSAFLERQSAKFNLSQRGVSACLKLARTIADMEGRAEIELSDLKEAVGFRVDSGPLDSTCLE
ncbi:YifB family Mg chelatase-like AAA ATPase [Treponema berlinense]|uniref:YifB family Mg chelatase-like AAA ATPase n=1 Tax=Treponema berlinense TaxID=225004 RepID=UPI0026EA3D06|nr:YifB family Mg chelatase-like AAA ATPase [Treponema berlinense]